MKYRKIKGKTVSTRKEAHAEALPREKESDIQASICAYLSARRHFFWRNNNAPIYDPTRQAFRAMPKYTMRGLPDIIVIKDGWFIGLEVKRPRGAVSPHQKAFAALCSEHGAEYYVVRSIEDVQEVGL